jgi:hypothetical protein
MIFIYFTRNLSERQENSGIGKGIWGNLNPNFAIAKFGFKKGENLRRKEVPLHYLLIQPISLSQKKEPFLLILAKIKQRPEQKNRFA